MSSCGAVFPEPRDRRESEAEDARHGNCVEVTRRQAGHTSVAERWRAAWPSFQQAA